MSSKYDLSTTHKQNVGQFRELIGKCRGIVGFFNHSDICNAELKASCNEDGSNLKQLIQEVSTRWNSTYAMVKRIHDQATPINRVLSNANKFNLMLTEHEIRVLKETIAVFMPLSQATELLSASSYPTAGLVIPVYHKLKILLADLPTDTYITKSVRYVLRKGLDIYSDKYSFDDNDYLVAAAYLHPNYKLFNNMPNAQDLSDSAEEIIRDISVLVENNIPILEPSNQSSQIVLDNEASLFADSTNLPQTYSNRSLAELLRSELSRYKADILIESPIKYWSHNTTRFPILSTVAKVLLCIPATSVPSECLFSHAGHAIWDRRNRLTPRKIDKMMFLYDNRPDLIQKEYSA